MLSSLAELPRGATVSELAATLDLNRTVVYRLVSTLEQHDLARRDQTGRVHLGLGVLVLARIVQPMLRHLAVPALRTLAEDCGATAHLTVVDGDEALAVAVVEPSWTDYHVAYRVGVRHSLERGAAGKAILLGRTIAAGGAPPEPFVLTVGELQEAAYGVAAPVLGVPDVEASVGVVALSGLDTERVGPRVTAAAHEIATSLSGPQLSRGGRTAGS